MGKDAGADYAMISKSIRGLIDAGERDFIIYPYGYIGRMIVDILQNQYGIKPCYLIDNNLCRVNPEIKSIDFLKEVDSNKYMVLLAVENQRIVESIRHSVYSRYDRERVFDIFCYTKHSDLRVSWLRNFSEFVYEKGLTGNVAECGVFKGNFAKYINEFFPDRKCYLFDSFEGFQEKDIEADKSFSSYSQWFKSISRWSDTTVKGVVSKMPYPEQLVVRKGYVPETFEGIDDVFCFVNLDMDLYQPMLEGLRFFYPKMVNGGVLLLHDYYSGHYLPGVKNAVSQYEKETGQCLYKIPSESSSSLVILKP